MLATRIRQKDSVFYFMAVPAQDLLTHVRFVSRYEMDGERIAAERIEPDDDVAAFIQRIERRESAFQRELVRRKVREIRDFYVSATGQPPIPASVLLYTPERLTFSPLAGTESVGNLEFPLEKFLVIDGQHRLAALHFYVAQAPDEAKSIYVPCMVFDGSSEDFATEMFVTINSTQTRINKSHLVDLYERVTWTSPDRKLAARVVQLLYQEHDSPLRYKINRLGGRSRREKWILQSELFHEVHRWVRLDEKRGIRVPDDARPRERDAWRRFAILRDFLRAAADVWGDAWGNEDYAVTRPVTLKAMVRVAADLAAADEEPAEDRPGRWRDRLAPWADVRHEYRLEGFYERFAARGSAQRVARVHSALARRARVARREEAAEAEAAAD